MKKIAKIWSKILDVMTAGNAYMTGGEELLQWHLDQKETA